MTAPAVFTFTDQQVRTVAIDGDPWFVLADVCRVLGIGNSRDVARRVPESAKGVGQIDTPGGPQQMTVVNEAGLYRVVLRSDAPNAEPFITWVTDDVLPTIRKTGRYGSDVEMLAALPSSQMLLLASQAAERAEAAEARVVELEPKLLVRAGADTGRNRLFGVMADLGWIFRKGDGWHAYQSATAYVVPRINRPVTDLHTGALRNVPPTIRITGKGLDRLAGHFGIGPALLAAVVS